MSICNMDVSSVNIDSSTSGSNSSADQLRPALSLRILHAEDQSAEYIVYVIWVLDVQSGVEWVVRKRFREFFDFREVLFIRNLTHVLCA